jgi:type II secretory ATPase GspE/PulE/Tfp pilus assembly ATPase PilB-like protein
MVAMSLQTQTYPASCWSCLGDFDAVVAAWCSHDPRLPSKQCPACGACGCDAGEKHKQAFWRGAPAPLLDDLEVLSRGTDRLAEELVRTGRLATGDLLKALVVRRRSGESLASILQGEGLVPSHEIAEAQRSSGAKILLDTEGAEYSAKLVCEDGNPGALLSYLLSLAARRNASDVQLEPKQDAVAVRYRIDGFTFKIDPLPKQIEGPLFRALYEMFGMDPGAASSPQRSRTAAHLRDGEYDLVAQTLPTPRGVSASIKLINRATFIKDFASLGLGVEDRVRLVEELRRSFGLVLVTAPAFEGGNTTAYSIMDFLVRAQRHVVSLEDPVQWIVEGAWQVEARHDEMRDALRGAATARPDVIVMFGVPDAATALLAAQLASSLLVVAVLPAQSAVFGIQGFVDLGVPRHLLGGTLSVAMCQRLLRRICPICIESGEVPTPPVLLHHGIGPEDSQRLAVFRGRGCPTCNRLGYRGRRAVFELLTGTPEVAAAVASGFAPSEVETLARGTGLRSLRERTLDLVADGITSFEEFARLRL